MKSRRPTGQRRQRRAADQASAPAERADVPSPEQSLETLHNPQAGAAERGRAALGLQRVVGNGVVGRNLHLTSRPSLRINRADTIHTPMVDEAKGTIEKKEGTDSIKNLDQEFQKGLKMGMAGKEEGWMQAARYLNAFSTEDILNRLNKPMLKKEIRNIHLGAINAADVGPFSHVALLTNSIPSLPAIKVAEIEANIKANQFQAAADILVGELGAAGKIDLNLFWGKKINYLASKAVIEGAEGRALSPGYDVSGKARPTAVNIGPDAFSSVPFLYTTILHEYQHVLQFQQTGPSLVPGQSVADNDYWNLQEVEAYASTILKSKETGLYGLPGEITKLWFRLHDDYWVNVSSLKRKPLAVLYTQAYKIAQKAVGKKVLLPFQL